MRARVPCLGDGEHPAVAVDQLGFARYEGDEGPKQLVGCRPAHSRRSEALKNAGDSLNLLGLHSHAVVSCGERLERVRRTLQELSVLNGDRGVSRQGGQQRHILRVELAHRARPRHDDSPNLVPSP